MTPQAAVHELRVGVAGWSYPDWNGIVYPRPMPRGVDRLTYAASLFGVIEVNTTYYRPAPPEMVDGWVRKTQGIPDFRFTVKLWQRFTHERESAWTRSEVRVVREALDRLEGAGRLGAVLAQFPWSFRRTDENVAWLEDVLAAFESYPRVVELRHSSWNVPETYAELSERGVGFVNIDQPLFRHSIAPGAAVTSAVGYVRVHGRNYREWFRKNADPAARYDYLYSAAELRPWVRRTREIAAAARETFVVMNNHRRGKGAANAKMFEAMLERHKVAVPETLLEEYPETLGPYARRARGGISGRTSVERVCMVITPREPK